MRLIQFCILLGCILLGCFIGSRVGSSVAQTKDNLSLRYVIEIEMLACGAGLGLAVGLGVVLTLSVVSYVSSFRSKKGNVDECHERNE